MLACAEDDQGIVSNFSLIYLIGDAKNGYVFPERDSELRILQELPHAAVCNKHLRGLRSRVLKGSYQDIDKEAYAVHEGIDDKPWLGMGYVSIFGCAPDTERVKYLSGEEMYRYFPGAQKVILECLLDNAVQKMKLDDAFVKHRDGILRHFSSDEKTKYRIVKGAEEFERAFRMLAARS